MPLRPSFLRAIAALALVSVPCVLDAQVTGIRSIEPDIAAPVLSTLKVEQAAFEEFRRNHLPGMSFGRGPSGTCDERVGRFCYWYDEKTPAPPKEPDDIGKARKRFITRLDSNARAFPSDQWTSGQLVRYLTEAGRNAEAVAAAGRCDIKGWWCHALRGFALHAANRYAASDSAWERSLAAMDERQRCDWTDLKMVLDDDLLRDYRAVDCAKRSGFERRVWWLSRPMMSLPGSDAQSEYLSRRLYTTFVEVGPSVHSLGFDDDERELLLRYGWPRAWTQETVYNPSLRRREPNITGHEPSPAQPMLPMATTVKNPAFSDSLGWRGKGLPGVRARYAPDYARRLLPLTHQSAIFRRGDSAVVVLSYDVSATEALTSALGKDSLTAALIVTKGEESDATVVRLPKPGVKGILTARTTWSPMLMSAEVAAISRGTLARARYGMRASDMPGARVQISDLLLFDPYDDMPLNLEQVIPHARSSSVIGPNTKLGVYWETYNTNPSGEGIQVAITVAPEAKEGGWMQRGLQALRLAREAQPVSVGISDVSARGLAYSPRAVVVDLSTLKPGRYLMQLEISAAGTPPVRAERMLTVRAN